MKKVVAGVMGVLLAASAFASGPMEGRPGDRGEFSPGMQLQMEHARMQDDKAVPFDVRKKQVKARIAEMQAGLDKAAKCVDAAKVAGELRDCLPKPPKKGPWGERRDKMNHEMEREHRDDDFRQR